MFSRALRASSVASAREAIADLTRRKAEAAEEDRFEEAMELRNKISAAKEQLPRAEDVAAWRAALCSSEERNSFKFDRLKESLGFVQGVDASAGSAAAALESGYSEAEGMWARGEKEAAAKAQSKLLAGVRLRSLAKEKGTEKVTGVWAKLLSACAGELSVGKLLRQEADDCCVKGSAAFASYVRGLGEVVRVSRLIGGSADLMRLDGRRGGGDGMPLCGEERRSVEECWERISGGGGGEEGEVPTGCEIEDQVVREETREGERGGMCDITLLPLGIGREQAGGGGERFPTMSTVGHLRKDYFACVINLHVNKVGIHV